MKVQPTTQQLIAMLYERLPELFDRPQRNPLTRKQLADAWIGTAHITHATERQIAYARAVEAAHGITKE
jgi:hypothetical protein